MDEQQVVIYRADLYIPPMSWEENREDRLFRRWRQKVSGREFFAWEKTVFVEQLLGVRNPGARILVDPAGTADVQRSYPRGIPWTVFKCYYLLIEQVYGDILGGFEDAGSLKEERIWWEHYAQTSWNTMLPHEIQDVIGAMGERFNDAERKARWLCEDLAEEEGRGDVMRQYIRKVVELNFALKQESGCCWYKYYREDSEYRLECFTADHLRRLGRYFGARSQLLSDLTYWLRHRDDLDLDALDQLPSRNDVIKSSARVETDLMAIYVEVRERGQDECGICFEEWLDESRIRRKYCEGCINAWRDGIRLPNGCCARATPIKMPCGHIFCVICLQRMLREEQGIGCPLRDMDYGIPREPELKCIQRICRGMAPEYHACWQRRRRKWDRKRRHHWCQGCESGSSTDNMDLTATLFDSP